MPASSSSNLNRGQFPSTAGKRLAGQQLLVSEVAPAAAVKDQGKAPAGPSLEGDTDCSEENTETTDEVLADLAQFHEFRLASQAFETDCFDVPF